MRVNVNTVSAECLHGMCPACRYEDCACDCHGIVENCEPEEELEDRYDRELDEEGARNGYY